MQPPFFGVGGLVELLRYARDFDHTVTSKHTARPPSMAAQAAAAAGRLPKPHMRTMISAHWFSEPGLITQTNERGIGPRSFTQAISRNIILCQAQLENPDRIAYCRYVVNSYLRVPETKAEAADTDEAQLLDGLARSAYSRIEEIILSFGCLFTKGMYSMPEGYSVLEAELDEILDYDAGKGIYVVKPEVVDS